MKDLINRAIGFYFVAITFLIAVTAALIVVARFAAYVPLLLVAVVVLAAVWRWVRGDWG